VSTPGGTIDHTTRQPGRLHRSTLPCRSPRVQRNRPTATPGLPIGLSLEDGRQISVPDSGLRIGRALDNDLVVADSRVSRYHAQIMRAGPGWIVRDLGSTNGTALGGRVVNEDRLSEGDTLSLGGYRIEIRSGPGAGPGRR